MKKIYMLLLIISAIILGGLIGNAVTGPLSFLGYEKIFQFMRNGDVVDTSVFKMNFGFYIKANVAQVFCILMAIFVYYKSAPKLFTGK